MTATVTLSLRLPPGPEQVSTKVLVADSAPELPEPVVPLLPLHAPEAVQLVASVLDQMRLVALPLSTAGFAALRFTTGTGSG